MDPRQAMQMALRIIELRRNVGNKEYDRQADEAAQALCAALSAQQEPSYWMVRDASGELSLFDDEDEARKYAEWAHGPRPAHPLYTHPALSAQQEPANPDPLHLSRILHELAGAASLCWEPKPAGEFDAQKAIGFVEAAIAEIRQRMAYTHPAPTVQPLTEPQIHRLWRKLGEGEGIEEFARAIERAHGIGGTHG